MDDSGRAVFISGHELRDHGCRVCLWRLHGQCSFGISDLVDGSVPLGSSDAHIFVDRGVGSGKFVPSRDGICGEYADFIMSFAEGGDSVSALWEKFNVYVARLQSLEDYAEFVRLNNEFREIVKLHGYGKKAAEVDMRRNSLKLWWVRLNDSVVRGLGRIVDRESREKVPELGVRQVSVQQLNVLLDASAARLLGKKGDGVGDGKLG